MKISCEVNGLSPYFFSKPTKLKKTPKTEAQMKEAALANVYCNGHLYIPDRQILGVIKGGCQISKQKLEKSNKRAIELYQALLYVTPTEIYFQKKRKMKDVKLVEYPCPVDNGKMIWNWYSYIDLPWTLTFELEFGDVFEPGFVKDSLESGGMLCGIGGRRSQKNGKFEIVKFEQLG